MPGSLFTNFTFPKNLRKVKMKNEKEIYKEYFGKKKKEILFYKVFFKKGEHEIFSTKIYKIYKKEK